MNSKFFSYIVQNLLCIFVCGSNLYNCHCAFIFQIFDAAVRGLRPVEGPQPVKFPLRDPCHPSSLRPGSLASSISSSRLSAVEKPPSVNAAIEGARAAASQFSKKDQTKSTIGNQIYIVQNDDSEGTSQNVFIEENRRLSHFPNGRSYQDDLSPNHLDQQTCPESRGSGRKDKIVAGRGFSPQSEVPPSKASDYLFFQHFYVDFSSSNLYFTSAS